MLAQRWPDLSSQDTRAYLNALVSRIVIKAGSVVIGIDPEHVIETIMVGPPAVPATRSREGRREASRPVALEIPATLKRAGTGVRLIVQGAANDASPDRSLIRLLVRAFAIREKLDKNPDLTMQQVADAEGVVPSYVTRLLRLTFLAPDIVAAIVDGRQPVELTANRLMSNTRLPLEWQAQRELLGVAAAR